MIPKKHWLLLIILIAGCNVIVFGQRLDLRNPEILKKYTVEQIKQSYFDYFKIHGCDNTDRKNKWFFRWIESSAAYVDKNGFYSRKKSLLENKKNNLQSLSTTYEGDWKEIITNKLTNGGGGTGRVTCMAFDPLNNQVIYSASAYSGLWKTTDQGSTWELINKDLPVVGVSAIAIDPNNGQIIYIGTGDGMTGQTISDGIYKSTDGGMSWTKIFSTPSSSWKKEGYNSILIDPSNSSRIVVATSEFGYFLSTDAGVSFNNSTPDGMITDMEFLPNNSNRIISGVYNEGISYSMDGGATFNSASIQNKPSGISRVEITVSEAAPNTIFALLGSSNGNGSHGVWKSVDGGVNFSSVHTGAPHFIARNTTDNTGGQNYLHCSFEVSDVDPNLIVAGGIYPWYSSDGGVNWSQLNPSYLKNGLGNSVHVDYCEIKYENNNWYFATDGGIYQTSNLLSNWNFISEGVNGLMLWGMDNSRSDRNLIAFGLQDNGSNIKIDNSGSFSYEDGGDGMHSLIDDTDNNLIFVSAQGSNYKRSINKGSSWQTVLSSTQTGENTPFESRIFQNEINPLEFFIPHQNVWKSVDRGATWLKTGDIIPGGYSGRIEKMEISPSNPDIMIVRLLDWSKSGREKYPIYKSVNGGTTWARINEYNKIGNKHRAVSFAFDPIDPDVIYSLYEGDFEWNPSEVIVLTKSTDGGLTWTNITDGLPASIIHHDIIVTRDHDVFVGSDLGVFLKENATWVNFNEKLPKLPIKVLQYLPELKILRAATYGRGIWETVYPENAVACENNTNLTSTANSDSIQWNWTNVLGANNIVKYKLSNVSNWTTQQIGNANSFTLYDLNEGDSYDFKVGNICGIDTNYNSNSTKVSCSKIYNLNVDFADDKATLSWDHSQYSNFVFSYRKSDVYTWTNINVSGKSTTVSGLEPNKSYYVKILTDCGSASGKDTLISIPNFGFCDVDFGYAVQGYSITNVTVNTDIQNYTGVNWGAVYNNYLNLETVSKLGGALDVTIEVENQSLDGSMGFLQVWIDYNQDDTFSNSEKVISTTTDFYHNQIITVPVDAEIGNTRMRFSVTKETYNYLGPCSDYIMGEGEIEDYTLIVEPLITNVKDEPINKTISIYPNPSSGVFSIETSMASNVELYDLSGAVVFKGSVKNQIVETNLMQGLYFMNVFDGSQLIGKSRVLIVK